MRLQEQNYSTDQFYPRPEVLLDPGNGLFLNAFPWSDRAIAQKTLLKISDHFLSTVSDPDATSPFAKLPYLTAAANNLRIAVILAAQAIYKDENLEEYTQAIEFVAILKQQNELLVITVGGPNIFLKQPAQAPRLLIGQWGLQNEFSVEKQMAPLPSNLLGLDMTPNLQIANIRTEGNEQIIMISGRSLSNELLSQTQNMDLNSLMKNSLNENAVLPFWLATLDLNNT